MFTQWSFLLSHGSAFFKIFETTDLVSFKSALWKHGFPKSKHFFQPQFQPGSIIHTLTSLSSFGFSTSLKDLLSMQFYFRSSYQTNSKETKRYKGTDITFINAVVRNFNEN